MVIDPYADSDAVTENYDNAFNFNLLNGSLSGASSGAVYNLLDDSTLPNKLQAVGTTVIGHFCDRYRERYDSGHACQYFRLMAPAAICLKTARFALS